MPDAVHDERVKLTASPMNAMPAGVFITGVIAPGSRGTLRGGRTGAGGRLARDARQAGAILGSLE